MKLKHLILLCPILCLFGCGERLPKDFPKVVPCVITVRHEGKPIDETRIILAKPADGEIAATGMTNPQGTAEIRTIHNGYVGPGAPPGKYRVVLIKVRKIADTKTQDERDAMTPKERTVYEAYQEELLRKLPYIVPRSFEKFQTTPVELNVAEPSTSLTIDVDQYQ